MRNRTMHELSWLTAISDAGSTPAASTILHPLATDYTSADTATSANPSGIAGSGP